MAALLSLTLSWARYNQTLWVSLVKFSNMKKQVKVKLSTYHSLSLIGLLIEQLDKYTYSQNKWHMAEY